jgi:hypothetical protein
LAPLPNIDWQLALARIRYATNDLGGSRRPRHPCFAFVLAGQPKYIQS